MKIRSQEERSAIIDAIQKDLAEVIAKYQDADNTNSRELIYAIAGTVRSVKPCPDVSQWGKFVDGALYLTLR